MNRLVIIGNGFDMAHGPDNGLKNNWIMPFPKV